MTGRLPKITGCRVKDGKLVKTSTAKDASAKIRERTSKRVRVIRTKGIR